jgi:hypothetical protein
MFETLSSRWQCYRITGTAMGFIGTAWRHLSAWQENNTPDRNYKILCSQKAWQYLNSEKDTGRVNAMDIYPLILL